MGLEDKTYPISAPRQAEPLWFTDGKPHNAWKLLKSKSQKVNTTRNSWILRN